MTAEPIELRLTIGDQTYTYTGVADIEDPWFAMKLGRAISEVVLEHHERAARETPHVHDWQVASGYAPALLRCATCGATS